MRRNWTPPARQKPASGTLAGFSGFPSAEPVRANEGHQARPGARGGQAGTTTVRMILSASVCRLASQSGNR
jgi:hypothetical protein